MADMATFLGTGSSLGVPLVGCHCEVCRSDNPKNKRFRSSLLLEIQGKSIVIDTGPDFRSQALTNGLERLDGAIYTHAHHDHVAGIDDLRVFSFQNKQSFPCLCLSETAKDLENHYPFMFKVHSHEFGARLKLIVLPERKGDVDFLGVPIHYFTYEQIGMPVMGVRIGSFAYVTDIKDYDPKIFAELKGVKTLVISALRFTHSHMHLTVDEAVDFIQKTGCSEAYLTHISHDVDHDKANACLPSSIQFAYDGMKISIE